MPRTSSVQIRRQIGLYQKQAKRHLSTIPTILSDYDIQLLDCNISHLDDDILHSLRIEIRDAKASLFKAYSKLTQLHSEWQLLQNDRAERTVFDEYISKYGDYREIISSSAQQLEQLDLLMNEIDKSYPERNLPVSSNSSDAVLYDSTGTDRELHERPRHQSCHLLPRPEACSTNQSTMHLLNFVDASILSKLELPTFDGNLLEYPEFSARFATLVGDKPQLDNVTKLSLLKSCLRGRALQSIEGLSMTASNYSIAIDILKTLYDDRVTMRHILYTKLAQLPPCDPEGRQLPMLYNKMYALVRQFGNDDDTKETALGAILLNKLPMRVRSQVYDRTANSHNVTPTELLDILTGIVRKDSSLLEMEYHSRNPSSMQHSATATDCSEKPPKMSLETQSPTEKLISTSISQSTPTTTETPINDYSLITLMCTTVTLFNPSEPSKQMEVTAFLDSGSNKSYITQHVAATLQLSTLAKEEINVCTFATKDSLQLQCENHSIGIYTEKGARQLDVKSVPTLTRALYRAQLAQSGDSNSITVTTCEPSILIGNDYFWDMVLSENFYYKALSNGYHLLHTAIGDIVVNKVLDVKSAITYTPFNEGVANPSHHEDLAEL
ncbi:hypothetical protein GCK32_003001, partial [Trichostrongylus colubriformis]